LAPDWKRRPAEPIDPLTAATPAESLPNVPNSRRIPSRTAAHVCRQDSEPDRPALRWHGGKWLLAPWIIDHLPPHRVYVEPFGGAASVLLRKPRAYAEIYNDLDSHVVGLFRVLRDPAQAVDLALQIELTPFARDEFLLSYEPADDPVEAARRLIVRSFMGFGSDGATGDYRTGFRSASNRSGTTPAHDWRSYPDALPAIIDRLRGVVIENRDAMEVMRRHDGLDTLHYVDPPYMLDLRSRTNRRKGVGGNYRHELTAEQHLELLRTLNSLIGMVVLSGYPSPVYDAALPGWERIERPALADGARKRTEVLWLNHPAVKALNHVQPRLLP
jgi:DNA adenine methylase